jgi:hypothetical protein
VAGTIKRCYNLLYSRLLQSKIHSTVLTDRKTDERPVAGGPKCAPQMQQLEDCAGATYVRMLTFSKYNPLTVVKLIYNVSTLEAVQKEKH